MFAIVAAILFALALIFELAEADLGISISVFVTAGLLCMALHMAGLGAVVRSRSGRWRARR